MPRLRRTPAPFVAKRGRRPAPNPRTPKVMLYLTADELTEIQGYAEGQPLGPFLRAAALRWLRSADARYERYHESGQAARDEAAEIAEDLAATE